MTFFTFDPETDEITLLEDNERDKNHSSPEDQIAMEMINCFINTCGYFDIPRKLMNALNYWIEAPEDKLEEQWTRYQITTAGVLMTQDICENRKLRRGKPTVHEVYGVPNTINAILHSTMAAFSIKAFETREIIIQHGVGYASNRDLHIELADQNICPTEELYYKICGNKGVLVSFSYQVLFSQELYAIDNIDLTKLVRKIEIFLTIVDECRRIAINRSEEEAVLKYALSIVKSSGCFEYAKKQLRLLRKEILEEHNNFARNALMDSFLNDYLDVPTEFEDVTWEL
ncbi:hypothetical protein ILUMI_21132 [Ignelater luminosus]|uniref:Uncharacterized protein n=1 Tax=Ignelater luminosus TaxID=2038154 RepID=A0A8K0G3V8_IGNLU|nr:hypothetical protein ILUMI_21132 [Ignelater luminosus]